MRMIVCWRTALVACCGRHPACHWMGRICVWACCPARLSCCTRAVMQPASSTCAARHLFDPPPSSPPSPLMEARAASRQSSSQHPACASQRNNRPLPPLEGLPYACVCATHSSAAPEYCGATLTAVCILLVVAPPIMSGILKPRASIRLAMVTISSRLGLQERMRYVRRHASVCVCVCVCARVRVCKHMTMRPSITPPCVEHMYICVTMATCLQTCTAKKCTRTRARVHVRAHVCACACQGRARALSGTVRVHAYTGCACMCASKSILKHTCRHWCKL